MMRRAYLDHNASSPLRPEAREAMVEAMALTASSAAGNPSSVHAEGRRARALIEDAREKVAALAGAAVSRVIFTSGGSEANAMALSPGWFKCDNPKRDNPKAYAPKAFVSAIEHASVLQGGRFAAADVSRLPVTEDGVVDLDEARRQFQAHRDASDAPFLVSLMLANNETGAIQPVTQLAAIAHELGGIVHTDAVQAAGKILLPGKALLDAQSLGADLITLSAHKIGGPAGVGALIQVNETLHERSPLLRGGGQERGVRSGTENMYGIVGFGAAAACAIPTLTSGEGEQARVAALRDRLENELLRISPEAVIFARNAARTPNTTCFAVAGMKAETVVISFDLNGVAISAGSACSSGKARRSPVIEAMRGGEDGAALATAALRVSLGWSATTEDVAQFLRVWGETYERFKSRT
jgi:cysteine desulfurase